jgi:hypothetical protein
VQSDHERRPVHALSIYFIHYNFVRIHQTLRCTPAMEAGVTDRRWSLEDMVGIVDEWEAGQKAEAGIAQFGS